MASRLPNEPIKVYLRVRPLNKFEETSGCNTALQFLEQTRISMRDDNGGEFQTDLDSVFDSTSDQEAVYNGTCASVPQQLLEGFDCAIFTYGASGTGKTYSILGDDATVEAVDKQLAQQAEDGIIPRLARGIFNAIQSSDSAVEYTVRCAVVEIYLDRIRDLLVETCHVRATEGKLRGCSRLSCLSADDMIDIVYRAHASRMSSAINPCRESSRSSMLVQVEIEQYDSRSQSVKASTLLVGDLVGSELSKTEITVNETRDMVSKSWNVLKRLAEERRKGVPVTMPLTAPPLSQLLSPYLGGSSHTTILLTGSMSDIASKETIDTIKFGEICRSIRNTPTPNVHERWQDCSMGLMEARENNQRLEDLVKVLANECLRLQSKSGARISSTTLENVISGIKDATAEHRDIKFSIETKAEHQIRTEQMKLKSETRRAIQTRDDLQSTVAQMQTDLQVLKDQNIHLLEGKEKAEAELARLRNEILVAQAQKTDLEHNLRTSQFRENEAVVFVRQFRRFYFRLRKKMAADGSGDISQIVQQIPGAPSLDNLVDIDKLMVDSGLLEQHEVGGDISTHSKASPEAMARSSVGVAKMISAANDNSIEGVDEIAPTSKSAVARENPQNIEARQRLYRTPAGKYLEMRENDLEAELMSASKKASQLEKALAEEKEKVETLMKNIGVAAALERLKNVKEIKVVKDQLEKKEHDLSAVIWKMNELHMTGKSLQAMLTERDSRILYLENSFNEASSQNVSLVRDKEQGDSSFCDEIATLVTRIRRFSEPVRYFGEPPTADTPLRCRLVVPFVSSGTISEAGINTLRRASIGERGEWIAATYSTEKTNAQTQTFTTETNDGQTQTEKIAKDAKDSESQTDEVRNPNVLVDAKTQTDVSVGTYGGFVASDAETQTEGILLTIKDIELSTIEAAASSISSEANVDDLLFMVTSREESFQNSQRELLQTGLVQNDELPAGSLSANAFLFMEDESVEDAFDEIKSPLDSDVTEKHATSIMTSSSHLRSPSALSTASKQDANKGASETASTPDIENDSQATLGKTMNEIVSKRLQAEEDESPEKFGTPEATRKEEKDLSTGEVQGEAKPNKPVSNFLAKLQAQARKKQAEQANDTIEKDTVPEFMKKFKTIGARNANESVIETSGESSSRQPNYGGIRFMDTSPSTPWQPRKRNNDDDDSEDDESNQDNTAPSGKSAAVESLSDSLEVVGQEGSTTAKTPECDEGSDTSSEPSPSSTATVVDDSDSSSDEDEKKSKSTAQASPPIPSTTLKAVDGSDSSSDEDDMKRKSATQVSTPGPATPSKTDDDSDSSSDDDEVKNKLASQTPIPGLCSSVKVVDDSDSTSDEDKEESKSVAQAPTPGLATTSKASDADSSSDEDEEESKLVAQAPIPGKLATQVSTPGLATASKAVDDSDSSIDEDEEEEKLATRVSTPGPATASKTDHDSDLSTDVDEVKTKSTFQTPIPRPSSPAKDVDDSDSSSDEDEEESKSVAQAPIPRQATTSKAVDDRASSSDEDEEERKSAIQAPTSGPATISKVNDDSDSSSDEDEEESKSAQAPIPGPSSTAKVVDDSDSISDEDEKNSKSTAQAPTLILSTTSKAVDDNDSSSDEDEEKIKPAAQTPKPGPSFSKADADSVDSSGSGSDEDKEEHKSAAQASTGKSVELRANNVPISQAPTQKARKESDDSDVSSSSDSSDHSSEDESTNKGSKNMLQGGKSTDFKPKRKVADFGANVSPALSPKKPVIKTKKKNEKDSKSKSEASTKSVKKGDKLVKSKANKEAQKSSTKSTADTKSSKFAVRGSDIVLADDGEWGKSASKKSVKGKPSFVIKNGKLVKNDAASPTPSKIEKPAFKIVGGKLVKQGKDDGKTKKAAGRSVSSRMGEI